NSRDCHNTRMVRDTKNLIIPLKINQSVTAPYGQNVPVAAIPIGDRSRIYRRNPTSGFTGRRIFYFYQNKVRYLPL
ncbi:MAG: hypothetical protein VKN72_29535, partial [Nostocales cyanobacterium 94392]|nr:hypothetical protein [Nostocales cyanobacterium 94392]